MTPGMLPTTLRSACARISGLPTLDRSKGSNREDNHLSGPDCTNCGVFVRLIDDTGSLVTVEEYFDDFGPHKNI